jgi:hypothetical protein
MFCGGLVGSKKVVFLFKVDGRQNGFPNQDRVWHEVIPDAP